MSQGLAWRALACTSLPSPIHFPFVVYFVLLSERREPWGLARHAADDEDALSECIRPRCQVAKNPAVCGSQRLYGNGKPRPLGVAAASASHASGRARS